MKNIVVLFLFSFVAGELAAQCNPYFVPQSGKSYEMTNYDKKGKESGRQVTTINSFDETSSGWDASLNFEVYDDKDKLLYDEENVEMRCEDGKLIMDMTRFIPSESMAAFEDANMTVDVDNMELPAELEVGMMLDGGSITISGDLPMTLSTDVTNRKVEGKETITTKAGSFDCYKISYDIQIKMVMGRSMHGVEWITKDHGVIKTESYNKNGKLIGSSELTAIK